MRIMLVCGSLHKASTTRAALLIASDVLQHAGAEVDFYDLGENRFPLYDPDADDDPPAVADFRAKARQAQGFILGTPEYHNGMTGALKNALDYLGSEEFRGKPVGLLCSAGGGKGGMNALNDMRIVVRGILGLALPDQAVVDETDFDEQLRLTNSARKGRIETMAHAVRRYVRLLEMESEGV